MACPGQAWRVEQRLLRNDLFFEREEKAYGLLAFGLPRCFATEIKWGKSFKKKDVWIATGRPGLEVIRVQRAYLGSEGFIELSDFRVASKARCAIRLYGGRTSGFNRPEGGPSIPRFIRASFGGIPSRC